jgi:hypothetical protein
LTGQQVQLAEEAAGVASCDDDVAASVVTSDLDLAVEHDEELSRVTASVIQDVAPLDGPLLADGRELGEHGLVQWSDGRALSVRRGCFGNAARVVHPA